MTKKTSLLKNNKGFKNLFIAQGVSILGDWFNTVALMGLVYTQTNDSFAVGLILIANALPGLILSPFLGTIVDRKSKKSILIASDVTRGILSIALIIFSEDFWMVFLIKMLFSISSSIFAPAKSSLLRSVVKESELVNANSSLASLWGLMAIVGASIGGVVSEYFGHSLSFLINSLSFFISAVFIFKIREKVEVKRIAQKSKHIFEEISDGFVEVRNNKILTKLIIIGISWGVIGGGYLVLLPVYAHKVWNFGDQGLGIMYAIQGLGVLLGGMILPYITKGKEEKMKKIFQHSYFFQGLFFILFSLSENIYLGCLCLLIMRVFSGFIMPLDSTLLQLNCSSENLGKVVSFHTAVFGFTMQVSMFSYGLLLRTVSPQILGSISGGICILICLLYYIKEEFYEN